MPTAMMPFYGQTPDEAARLLLQRIAEPRRALQREILQPTLRLRQSTGPCEKSA